MEDFHTTAEFDCWGINPLLKHIPPAPFPLPPRAGEGPNEACESPEPAALPELFTEQSLPSLGIH